MNEGWRPTASIERLRRRAAIAAGVRAFFAERDVLEVETPLLGAAPVTEPHVEAIPAEHPTGGDRLYLQTSPEYAMKRLLAAGSGPVYQLCRAFRRGERGARHNPEFTMLEWYRPGFSLDELMDEVAALAGRVLGERPVRRLSCRDAFLECLGLDPHTAKLSALEEAARRHASAAFDAADRDTWLQLLLGAVIEPRLGRGEYTFLHAFPASQAALARVEPDEHGVRVARRFELFVDGVELANGYDELRDAGEQRRRFEADCSRRREQGLPVPPVDERLLAALEAGMPRCSGVALGFDRLVMLATGAASIDEVIAFPLERA